MTKIDLQTEQINIAYPDAAALALELVVGAPGEVKVSASAAEDFVTGAIEYDVEEWKPSVEQSNGKVRVVQIAPADTIIPSGFAFVNRWNLQLGSARPFALNIEAGVGKGRWALGGLPITSLHLATGAGEHTLSFDAPNPQTMAQLNLEAGAGAVDVDGLLNARMGNAHVIGGVGSVTLRFTGALLSQDALVKVEGGVGHFAVIVAEDVPARVKTMGLGIAIPGGSFTRQSGLPILSGIFVTPAYESTQGPKLEFEVAVGVGAIMLDTR